MQNSVIQSCQSDAATNFSLVIDIIDPYSLDLHRALELALSAINDYKTQDSLKSTLAQPIASQIEHYFESQTSSKQPAFSPSQKGKRALDAVDSTPCEKNSAERMLNLISAALLLDAKSVLFSSSREITELATALSTQQDFDNFLQSFKASIFGFNESEGLLTMNIARIFRPLLLDLLSRFIAQSTRVEIMDLLGYNSEDTMSLAHYNFCVEYAFSLLYKLYPQSANLIEYFISSRSTHSLYLKPESESFGDSIVLAQLLNLYRLADFIDSHQQNLSEHEPNSGDSTNTKSIVYQYLPHSNIFVRYLACQCVKRLHHTNPTDQSKLESLWVIGYHNNNLSDTHQFKLSETQLNSLAILFNSLDNNRITLENQLLLDHNNVFNNGDVFATNNFALKASNGSVARKVYITESNLCELVVSVFGVLLSVNLASIHTLKQASSATDNIKTPSVDSQSAPLGNNADFVPTITSKKTLSDLALALSLHQPVLLSGQTGSGKSTYIEEIARLTGNELITIHLGDQTDPKVLLGTYVSGAKQGDFEWQPGVLTLAVKTGKWVLIEDIDSASSEVASILLPLLESRELFIAGRGERIPAHNRFQLIATQTVSNSSKPPVNAASPNKASETSSGILADAFTASAECFGLLTDPSTKLSYANSNSIVSNGCWNRVLVKSLAPDELASIITSKYPNLASIASDLVIMFSKIQQMSNERISDFLAESGSLSLLTTTSSRKLNNRDFFKFCRRISHQLSHYPVYRNNGSDLMNSPDGKFIVFAEAADCFLGSESNTDIQKRKLLFIASLIGVSKDRVDHFVNTFTPNISINFPELNIGRATLKLDATDFDNPESLEFSSSSDLNALSNLRKSHLSLGNKKSSKKSKPFSLTDHAKRLMEKIAISIELNEPALLSGETGTGKTTVVQYVADLFNQDLSAINLSQQSDSSDLLGGFKPVDTRAIAAPLKSSFDHLFAKTFSQKRNSAFIDAVRASFVKQNWQRLSKLFVEASKMASQVNKKKETKLAAKLNEVFQKLPIDSAGAAGSDHDHDSQNSTDSLNPSKKLKIEPSCEPQLLEEKKQLEMQAEELSLLKSEWDNFLLLANKFSLQIQDDSSQSMVFTYKEGVLVNAVKNGTWILLDEINLATPETLDSLSGLLQDVNGSILLVDRGDIHPIKRHPNFRLFACVNPATDVGKKSLPSGLRSRFSEYYVQPPDNNDADLLSVISSYLATVISNSNKSLLHSIKDFYRSARNLASNHKIVDGAQQRPNYSLRTLTRSLSFAANNAHVYSLVRSVYEGLYMTFATQLESESRKLLVSELQKFIFAGIKASSIPSLLRRVPQNPNQENSKSAIDEYIQFGSYWLKTMSNGGELTESNKKYNFDSYVLTDSVLENLHALARGVMCGEYPILIQGPTSAGKTSMIEYLANKTNHTFVRLNNHEHTDLQEYLGSYVAKNGKLVFQEGVLVQALRFGHWLVLDELNLAPSDVLEALNRLLDDNRELVIPETSEIVKPHKDFMLFATQNPAGLYGGRKHLSRAFRNRFLELHFDQMPKSELDAVLTTRCIIAPSHSKKLVEVYSSLTELRSQSRMFEAKNGFITLRDLFRWASRGSTTYQELAEVGYMLLAERIRKPSEKREIKSVLEKVFRVKIDPVSLYSMEKVEKLEEYQRLIESVSSNSANKALVDNVVWTFAMRRLFILTVQCLRFNDPVLLVGETGCGKTTVCQLLSLSRGSELYSLNCHQNTETADLLGGQRPVRNRSLYYEQSRKNSIEFINGFCSLDFGSLLDSQGQKVSLLSDSSLKQISELLGLFAPNVNGVEELFGNAEFFEPFYKLLSSFIYSDNSHIKSALKSSSLTNSVYQSAKLAIHYYQSASSLFEWVDGPLVGAMKTGSLFLLDEISLADDSVLERLNSVLEPSRTLLLAERSADISAGVGAENDNSISASVSIELVASNGFEFMATMNPGGDYGKRELSPALRNRFVEIWVPSVTNRKDLVTILAKRMENTSKLKSSVPVSSSACYDASIVIIEYMQWLSDFIVPTSIQQNTTSVRADIASSELEFGEEEDFNLLTLLSLREYLAWADFVATTLHIMDIGLSIVHGGCLVLLDGFGAHGSVGGKASTIINSTRTPGASSARSESTEDKKKSVKNYLLKRLLASANVTRDHLQSSSPGTSGLNTYLNSGFDIHTENPLFGIIDSKTIAKTPDTDRSNQISKKSAYSDFLSKYIKVNFSGANNSVSSVGVEPFYIDNDTKSSGFMSVDKLGFALHAPTSFDNFVKILRGMQIRKPLLLEGSPGVGKTTLVEALARLTNHKLERINLSDQTDLMDLFGTDLPVENGQMGQFEWRDAPFLKAMQNGDWVLLDEINLATQSVLEGLNSVLDHRGYVYISELGKEFYCHPNFYLFAAQNPVVQGGGRKGLPRSFLSRFTQVYMEELTSEDMEIICLDKFGKENIALEDGLLLKILEFNSLVNKKISHDKSFGRLGSPWEFNLRDVYRLLEITSARFDQKTSGEVITVYQIVDFLRIIYVDRMRTYEDRSEMWNLISSAFGGNSDDELLSKVININQLSSPATITPHFIQIGNAFLGRKNNFVKSHALGKFQLPQIDGLNTNDAGSLGYNQRALIKQNLSSLSSLMHCIQLNQMAIVVGNSGVGKSSIVQFLANSCGQKLLHFSMNSSVDTLELLGGFEKIDLHRHWSKLLNKLQTLVSCLVHYLLSAVARQRSDEESMDVDADVDVASTRSQAERMNVDLEYSDTNETTLKGQILNTKLVDTGSSAVDVTRIGLAERLNFLFKSASKQTQDVKLAQNLLSFLSDLLGSNEPSQSTPKNIQIPSLAGQKLLLSLFEDKNVLTSLHTKLSEAYRQFNVYENLTKTGVLGKFEFIDGVLIDSLVNGNWILIDKANLCSPSVLDRLNGLLEPNGQLILGECGVVENENGEQVVRTIKKHENFRIILTVDPRYGELSRAMRNRGIEIAVLPPQSNNCNLAPKENSQSSLISPLFPNIEKTDNDSDIDVSTAIENVKISPKEISLEDYSQSKYEYLATSIFNQLKVFSPFNDFIQVAKLHQLADLQTILKLFSVAASNTGCSSYSQLNPGNLDSFEQSKLSFSSKIGDPSALLRNFVQLSLQAITRIQRGSPVDTLKFTQQDEANERLSYYSRLLKQLNIRSEIAFHSLRSVVNQLSEQAAWSNRNEPLEKQRSVMDDLAIKFYSLYLSTSSPYTVPIIDNDPFYEVYSSQHQISLFLNWMHNKALSANIDVGILHPPDFDRQSSRLSASTSNEFLDCVAMSLNDSLVRYLPPHLAYIRLVQSGLDTGYLLNEKKSKTNFNGRPNNTQAGVDSLLFGAGIETLLKIRIFMFDYYKIIDIPISFVDQLPMDLSVAPDIFVLVERKIRYYYNSFNNTHNSGSDSGLPSSKPCFADESLKNCASASVFKYYSMNLMSDLHTSLTELVLLQADMYRESAKQKLILNRLKGRSQKPNSLTKKETKLLYIDVAYRHFESKGLDVTSEQLAHKLLQYVFPLLSSVKSLVEFFIRHAVDVSTSFIFSQGQPFTSQFYEDIDFNSLKLNFSFKSYGFWKSASLKLGELSLLGYKLFKILLIPRTEDLDVSAVSTISEQLLSKYNDFISTFDYSPFYKELSPSAENGKPINYDKDKHLSSLRNLELCQTLVSSDFELISSEVKTNIINLCTSVKLESNMVTRKLWEVLHPVTLPTHELRRLEFRLLRLLYHLSLLSQRQNRQARNNLSLFSSTLEKSVDIIQALATLYTLSSNNMKSSLNSSTESTMLIHSFEKMCLSLEKSMGVELSDESISNRAINNFESPEVSMGSNRNFVSSELLKGSSAESEIGNHRYINDNLSATKIMIFDTLPIIDRAASLSATAIENNVIGILGSLFVSIEMLKEGDSYFDLEIKQLVDNLLSILESENATSAQVLKNIFPDKYYHLEKLFTSKPEVFKELSLSEPSSGNFTNSKEPWSSCFKSTQYLFNQLRMRWTVDSISRSLIDSETEKRSYIDALSSKNSQLGAIPGIWSSNKFLFYDQVLNKKNQISDLKLLGTNPELESSILEDDLVVSISTSNAATLLSPAEIKQFYKPLSDPSSTSLIDWQWPLPTDYPNILDQSVWTPSVFYLSHLSSNLPIAGFSDARSMSKSMLKTLLNNASEGTSLFLPSNFDINSSISHSVGLENLGRTLGLCRFIKSNVSDALNDLLPLFISMMSIEDTELTRDRFDNFDSDPAWARANAEKQKLRLSVCQNIIQLQSLLLEATGSTDMELGIFYRLRKIFSELCVGCAGALAIISRQFISHHEIPSLAQDMPDSINDLPILYVISKLAFDLSLKNLTKSIDLVCTLLTNNTADYDFTFYYGKSLSFKGTLLMSFSVLLALVPSDPIDPASQSHCLTRWTKESLLDCNINFVTSNMLNKVLGSNRSAEMVEKSFCKSQDLVVRLAELSKMSIFRPETSDNNSNDTKSLTENSVLAVFNSQSTTEFNSTSSFKELWISMRKLMSGVLDVNKILSLINNLTVMFTGSAKNGSNKRLDFSLTSSKIYSRAKNMASALDDGLENATNNITKAFGNDFGDLVLLWLNKVSAVRFGIQNLVQTSAPHLLYPTESKNTLHKLLSKELVKFPISISQNSTLFDLVSSSSEKIIFMHSEPDSATSCYGKDNLQFLFDAKTWSTIKYQIKTLNKIKQIKQRAALNSSENARKLVELNLDGSESSLYLRFLLNILVRISVSVWNKKVLDSRFLDYINKLFCELYTTWQNLEKLRSKQIEEQNSLYKAKKGDENPSKDLTDEEIKKRDHQRWFPEFDRDFEIPSEADVLNSDLQDQGLDDTNNIDGIGNQKVPELDDKILNSLFGLHSWVFNNFIPYIDPETTLGCDNGDSGKSFSNAYSNPSDSLAPSHKSIDLKSPINQNQNAGAPEFSQKIENMLLGDIISSLIDDSFELSSELGGKLFASASLDIESDRFSEFKESIVQSLSFGSEVDSDLAASHMVYLSSLNSDYANSRHSIQITKKSAQVAKGSDEISVQSSNDYSNLLSIVDNSDIIQVTSPENISEISRLLPLASFAKTTSKVPIVYDFYHDANLSESRKVYDVINPMLVRICQLLEEYDDNSVLIQSRFLCIKILNLPQTTPIAKLLTGVETLYTKGSDWEKYNSSKQTSVQPQLSAISSLIIHWRQIELYSWPMLMQIEFDNISNRSKQYWFNLFATFVLTKCFDADLIRPKVYQSEPDSQDYISNLSSVLPKAGSQNTAEIIEIIDRFLQTCSIGEFESRLQLLKTIANHRKSQLMYLRQVMKPINSLTLHEKKDSATSSTTCDFDITNNVLNNTIGYYSQFLAPIKSFIDESRSSISKDLAEFVKISSFSDVNPESLRLSARRTHSHLAKCLRKWRDALQQPTNSIIERFIKSNIQVSKLSSIASPNISNQGGLLNSSSKNKLKNTSTLDYSLALKRQIHNRYKLSELKNSKLDFKFLSDYIFKPGAKSRKIDEILSELGFTSIKNTPINHASVNSNASGIENFSSKRHTSIVNVLEYMSSCWDINHWNIKRYVDKYSIVSTRVNSSGFNDLQDLEIPSILMPLHSIVSEQINSATSTQFADFFVWFNRRNAKIDCNSLRSRRKNNNLGYWYTPYPNPITVSSVISLHKLERFLRKLKTFYIESSGISSDSQYFDLISSEKYTDSIELYFSSLSQEINYFQSLCTPTELLNRAETLLNEAKAKSAQKKVSSKNAVISNTDQSTFKTKISKKDGKIRIVPVYSKKEGNADQSDEAMHEDEDEDEDELTKKEANEIQNKAIRSYWSQQKQLRSKLLVDTMKQLKKIGLGGSIKKKNIENTKGSALFDLSVEIQNLSVNDLESYARSVKKLAGSKESSSLVLDGTHASIPLMIESTNEHMELLTYLNQAYREAYYLNESKGRTGIVNGRSEISQNHVDKLFAMAFNWNGLISKETDISNQFILQVTKLNNIISLYMPITGIKAEDTPIGFAQRNSDENNDLALLSCVKSLRKIKERKVFLDSFVDTLVQSISTIKSTCKGYSALINCKQVENPYASRDYRSELKTSNSELLAHLETRQDYDKNEYFSVQHCEYATNKLQGLLLKTKSQQSIYSNLYHRFFALESIDEITALNNYRFTVGQGYIDPRIIGTDGSQNSLSNHLSISNWNGYFTSATTELSNLLISSPQFRGFISPSLILATEMNLKGIDNYQNYQTEIGQDLDKRPNGLGLLVEIAQSISMLGNAVTVTLQEIFKTLDYYSSKTSMFDENLAGFAYLESCGKLMDKTPTATPSEPNGQKLDMWNMYPSEATLRTECYKKLYSCFNVNDVSSLLVDLYNKLGSCYGKILSRDSPALLSPEPGTELTLSTELARYYTQTLVNKRVLPLVQQYFACIQHVNNSLTQHHFQFIRSGRVFTQMVTSIFTRGIASADALVNYSDMRADDGEGDDDLDQPKKGNREFDTSTDPSGMGEGNTENAKNVSNEIEDEDQILGAAEKDKEDQPPENKSENKPAKNEDAIEMEAEFDGEIGDADLEPDASSDESADESQDEDIEMDEKLGHVDITDPTAVDEKMWDDQNDNDANNDKSANNDPEKQIKDSASKGNENQEMVAKEDEDNQPEGEPDDTKDKNSSKDLKEPKNSRENMTKDKEDTQENKDGGEDDDDEPADDSGADSEDEEDSPEANPNSLGARLPLADVSNELNDQLEIPDDLNLDTGKNEGEDETSMDMDPLDENDNDNDNDSDNDKSNSKDGDKQQPDNEMALDQETLDSLRNQDGDLEEEGGQAPDASNENEELGTEDSDEMNVDPDNKGNELGDSVDEEARQDEVEESENNITSSNDNPENQNDEDDGYSSDQKENKQGGEGEENDDMAENRNQNSFAGAQSFSSGLDSGNNEDDTHNRSANDQTQSSNDIEMKEPDSDKSNEQSSNDNRNKDFGGESSNLENASVSFNPSDAKPISSQSNPRQNDDTNNNRSNPNDDKRSRNRRNLLENIEQQKNPLRSLSNAVNMWEKRLNMIQNEENEQEAEMNDSLESLDNQQEFDQNDLNDDGLEYQFAQENEASDNTTMADTNLDVAKKQFDEFKNALEDKGFSEKNENDENVSCEQNQTKPLNETEDQPPSSSFVDRYNEKEKKANDESSTINKDSDININEPERESQTCQPQQDSSISEKLNNLNSDYLNPNKLKGENTMENEIMTFNNDQSSANDNTDNDSDNDNDNDNKPFEDDLSRKPETEKHNSDDGHTIIKEKKLVDLEKLKEELEVSTANWFNLGQDQNSALALWNGYLVAGQDNATRLSEQLRLILAPTLSSHLKGDYRTGKRLNMKRIIPYIASQYKRDKIWLRRTKPMKREYQVLLAVDDSKSMVSSQSNSVGNVDEQRNFNTIKLTFETLALLTNSLQLLEVGEMGVVSFGDKVNILHDFDKNLNLEEGARIISQMKFDQESTDIDHLLETSINLFNPHLAQGGSGGRSENSELWKLMLILSDGICQNHAQLRQIVLRAAELKIMIVFIVLDKSPINGNSNSNTTSASKGSSITEIKQVQYQTNSKGKMELVMKKYLDTFPFDFYLVLRDINGLPEVLSDALRQFFSLVAAE